LTIFATCQFEYSSATIKLLHHCKLMFQWKLLLADTLTTQQKVSLTGAGGLGEWFS